MHLWNWIVVDPIAQKKIQAVLWNDKIRADQSLVGKIILLSRFALHNYNGSLTLNSKVRSSIQVADYPAFDRELVHAVEDHKLYELVSGRRVKE